MLVATTFNLPIRTCLVVSLSMQNVSWTNLYSSRVHTLQIWFLCTLVFMMTIDFVMKRFRLKCLQSSAYIVWTVVRSFVLTFSFRILEYFSRLQIRKIVLIISPDRRQQIGVSLLRQIRSRHHKSARTSRASIICWWMDQQIRYHDWEFYRRDVYDECNRILSTNFD